MRIALPRRNPWDSFRVFCHHRTCWSLLFNPL